MTINRGVRLSASMVGAARVLDTGALLHLPPPKLNGGICADSQREEVERHDPDRGLLLEQIRIHWRQPSPTGMDMATSAAQDTGDISGLSPVDMDVVALALEHRAIIVTDDYRMQNIAGIHGVGWHPVLESGIIEQLKWELECKGCRAIYPGPDKPPKFRRKFGKCSFCGAKLKLKKVG